MIFQIFKLLSITFVSIIRSACMIKSLKDKNITIQKYDFCKYLYYFLPYDLMNIGIFAIMFHFIQSYNALKL